MFSILELPVGATCWSSKKTCQLKILNQWKKEKKTEVIRVNDEVEADWTIDIPNSDTYLVELISEPEPEKEKGTRKCGKCGLLGHNSRSCQNAPKKSAGKKKNKTYEEVMEELISKQGQAKQGTNQGIRRCSKCNKIGHNSQTCQVKK